MVAHVDPFDDDLANLAMKNSTSRFMRSEYPPVPVVVEFAVSLSFVSPKSEDEVDWALYERFQSEPAWETRNAIGHRHEPHGEFTSPPSFQPRDHTSVIRCVSSSRHVWLWDSNLCGAFHEVEGVLTGSPEASSDSLKAFGGFLEAFGGSLKAS
ncbi:hypothetical protein B0T16DRAFT_390186 [Cercophora newfieldiana]|uniref:Uncharacterized protein n=1 Tax=Cercophora newfieldiana TaxID=92897 RepID=A0AA39Y656_9PEZI|nr:hypothetical protein B0T16DRAFT_390186 [Cercophora newfieldiana]